MKKLAFALAISAAAIGATVALADDDASAKSVNAVGVVKYTIPGNSGLICVSLPMNPMDDTADGWVWVDTDVAKQLPIPTTVYFWDDFAWSASTKSRRGWNGIGATKVVAPGEAFFIKGGENDETVVSLLGELPVDEELSFEIRGGGNYDTRAASMYPVSEKFATSSMAESLPEGATVYFWDGLSWSASTKSRRGWNGVGATHTNAIGEGIFIRVNAEGSRTVTMNRPFDWD